MGKQFDRNQEKNCYKLISINIQFVQFDGGSKSGNQRV